MTKIKICGITRLQDALIASYAGADVLGFNFSHTSPRMITPDQAQSIIKQLPPFVQTAGIFVEQTPEEIKAICRLCHLDIVQLHSENYTPEHARSITAAKVIKVFRPEEDFAVDKVAEFAGKSGINTFLFDAYRPDMAGGTGESIGAALASRIFKELGRECFAILAGGLNAENVSEAIQRVQPYGVDTASGVESKPGIKDPEKIDAFIRAVRSAAVS